MEKVTNSSGNLNVSTMAEQKILEKFNVKIVVHDQQWDFDFDSYAILDPSETKSGSWELWQAEWHDPNLKQGDLEKKLIEVSGESVRDLEDFHLVLSSLQLGFEDGYQDGKIEMQKVSKLALKAMCGEVADSTLTEISELAEQEGT